MRLFRASEAQLIFLRAKYSNVEVAIWSNKERFVEWCVSLNWANNEFFAGFVYEFWIFWFFAPIIIGSKNKVNLGTISCVRTIKCYFFGCLTKLNFYWFTFDKPWNELRDILTAFRIGITAKCLVFMAKNLMFVS